jgi:hypothetical protein
MLMPMRFQSLMSGVVLAATCGATGIAAQTADRSAAPPAPATTAPPARSGTYTVQNGELIVAPGLRIPNGNVPWALDTVQGRQVLVPIHHSELKTADADTGKLEGATSHTQLRSAKPVFFVHGSDRTENAGDSGRGQPTGWALLAAKRDGTFRTVTRAKFSEVNSATVCAPPTLCMTAEALPDGWLRMVAREPLAPGEYTLLPVQRSDRTASAVAYDFTVDEQSASSKDTVSPGQDLDSKKHKKH